MASLRHIVIAALVCLAAGAAAAEDLCEFADATRAHDAGWVAKAKAGTPQATLHVTDDAKVGKTAVVAKGVAGQGAYGGLRYLRRIDFRDAGPRDTIRFWVKQNITNGIVVNIGFDEGPNAHRSVKAPRNQWTRVELALDLRQWAGGRKRWGAANRIMFYTKAFDAPGESLALDGLQFDVASQPDIAASAALRLGRWTFPQQTDSHWIIGNDRLAFAISKMTGAVAGGWNVKTKAAYVQSLEGVYFVETQSMEKEFDAAGDRVTRVLEFGPTRVKVECRNPARTDLRIVKQYDLAAEDNKLVRTLTLVNEGDARDLYATISSRLSLRRSFRDDGYYMGAGYVGPLAPAPDIAAPRRVSRYRISPKGMLLVNRRMGDTLAHYRYKVNGDFLFPWISKYVEPANSLYYTPTGWQMAMHTVALRPGQPATIEEHVMILPGSQNDFLSREYPKLPAAAKRYQQLTPRPKWREDIKLYAGVGCDEHIVPRVQELVKLTDEGNILILMVVMGPWTDYPSRGPMRGPFGGKITGEHIGRLVAQLHALSPRVKVGVYTWLTSASWAARPYVQHPDWFKPMNKAGNFVNLFPGCAANYMTHIEKKPCREYLLKQYADHFRDWNVDCIYLDGSKTTNLIDWRQNTITQDADWENFWYEMRQVCRKAGPDKALFFNGRATPYADISFIEARSEMREENWRDYAGLMACTKSFISSDPGYVIMPLYWIDRLSRSYVNHFIALGFTPAIGHGKLEALKKLPFIDAGYELRGMRQVDVDIAPDWQKDPLTKLESYSMRKGGAVVLGLIGHYDRPTTETVSVDAKKCGFDPELPVYVWEFDVAAPAAFEGRAPEAEVKRVYGETGWFLDRATSVRCRPAAMAQDGRVAVAVVMDSPRLKLLALTQTPAALWSVGGRPCHFNLPAVRGARIERTGRNAVVVHSERESCEVLLNCFMNSRGIRSVTIDGVAARSGMFRIGGEWFAKVRVAKGAHTVRWQAARPSSRVPRMELVCPASAAPGRVLAIQLRANAPAVLAAALDGRPVLCRRIEPGATEIPLPVALRGGQLDLSAYAGAGVARASVSMAAIKYEPTLKAVLPKTQPPKRRVWDVNRTVRGVKVLRAATSTYYSSLGSAPVAKCEPEKLTFEVGAADWYTSFMGHSFAGVEAEGMRVVTLDVRNTFYGEFNVRATRYHLHPYKRSSRPFAGLMVDYHTPEGYTKRVALSMGLLDMKRSTPQPDWGANRKPDQFVELCKTIDETNREQITIDLAAYAPQDWDSRVWFTPGVDWVAPNRRLIITIVNNKQQATGKVTIGADLADQTASFKKPRVVEVPKATFVPEVDGVMDEEAWREAAQINNFVLLDEAGLPRVWTRARLFYDDHYLYIGIQCQEPDRTAPIVGGPNIWRDDEVELWFDVDGDPKTTHQIIINARGDSLGLLPVGRWEHGAKTAGRAQKGMWTIEAAAPFKSLGAQPKPGAKWRFNIARHRPASPNSNMELITWAPLHGGFGNAREFGALVFKGTVAD